MNRVALEHILRAAKDCTGETDFIVVGSQAILASRADADSRLLVSNELDISPASDRQEIRDRIDGAIGELSPFHETNGYYAQAVSARTAYLPADWRDHAVVVQGSMTNGARAICPCAADVVASKLARGHAKDVAFATAALESGLIIADELVRRAAALEAPEPVRGRARELAVGLREAQARSAQPAGGDTAGRSSSS